MLAEPAPLSLSDEEEMDEEEDEAPIVLTPSKNPFLALIDDEEDEEDEEDDLWAKPAPPPPKPAPSTSRKKKQKKKKKNKQNAARKAEQAEDKLLEEAIQQAALEETQAGNKDESQLLEIDQRFLLAENELRRLFGSDAVSKPKKEANGPGRQRRQMRMPFFKQNTKLTRPDPQTWPPSQGDELTMSPVDAPEGADPSLRYFVFQWSEKQKQAQEVFQACIESGDPNSLFQLLGQAPYHVGTLLQLSELLKQTGDFQRAADLIERALYVFECGWHRDWDWKNNSTRLLHRHPENRDLFYALFRHIQMLGRRGCSRTGLECCKLLLSLDHSDPLFVVGTIDYFALRSKQYRYLLDFFEHFEGKPILLPNLYFSIALAAFLLVEEAEAGAATEGKVTRGEADRLLQQALLTFPVALPVLLEKCKKSLQDGMGRAVDVDKATFFNAAYRSPTLLRLINLYIDRCYSLWTSKSVQAWLGVNVATVLQRVASNDPMVEKCQRAVQNHYSKEGADSLSRIQASDYNDEVAAIPADLLEQQAVVPPPRVVPARTGNPLALFLQTLMPWNEVPNAPYQGHQDINLPEGEREHFLQQLAEWIGMHPDDLEEEDEEPDEQRQE